MENPVIEPYANYPSVRPECVGVNQTIYLALSSLKQVGRRKIEGWGNGRRLKSFSRLVGQNSCATAERY